MTELNIEKKAKDLLHDIAKDIEKLAKSSDPDEIKKLVQSISDWGWDTCTEEGKKISANNRYELIMLLSWLAINLPDDYCSECIFDELEGEFLFDDLVKVVASVYEDLLSLELEKLIAEKAENFGVNIEELGFYIYYREG